MINELAVKTKSNYITQGKIPEGSTEFQIREKLYR